MASRTAHRLQSAADGEESSDRLRCVLKDMSKDGCLTCSEKSRVSEEEESGGSGEADAAEVRVR